QVLVDAGLVALSYYLAYQLRFDGAVTPLYQDLLDRTIVFAVVGPVFCFATFSLLGDVAVVQPKLVFNGQGFTSVNVPTGLLVLYGLLMLVSVGGWRFLVQTL